MTDINRPQDENAADLCGTCGLPHKGLTGYNHNFVSRSSPSSNLVTKLRWIGGVAVFKEPEIARACSDAAAEIERLDADAANERAEKDSLAAIVRTRDAEIERITRECRHLASLWDRHNAEVRTRDEEIERLTHEIEAERGNAETIFNGSQKIAAERDSLTRELAEERQMHADVDAALKLQVDETERLAQELSHVQNLIDFTAPLSCPTHGLVPNLALFGNKCPACERDSLRGALAESDSIAIAAQNRGVELRLERDAMQRRAEAAESDWQSSDRERGQWKERHDRERAAHASNLTQQRKVEAQRDRLCAALEHWSHDGHLQTFEDRERFRAEVRALLAGEPTGNAAETPSPQAPIARIVIANDKIADAQLYAPGLPVGAHDLYCQPEAVAPMMRQHPGATPLSAIADKLDTAEELTDCERGCAADALRKLAEQDVLHVRLREYRMPARELPDDDLPEKAAEQRAPHFPDNETLRRQILGDPDDEPTAGNVP